jgi:multisubunit Na+/H+ antiporter MnhB subunit
MVVTALVLGLIGAAYGIETSPSTFGAVLTALFYGFVGVSIGVPLAFVMNVLRFWR